MTRLAEVKTERDIALSERDRYWLALRDILCGDMERGGKRITAVVKAGECDKGEARAEATILRPLGGSALIIVRWGSYVSVESEDWLSDTAVGPITMRVLQERARIALSRARNGG